MSALRFERKYIVELVGSTAIVASLIFVGLEMRQSRQIAVADIYQQKTALLIEVQQFMRTTDGRTNAYALILSDQPLTPDDEATIRRSNPTWIRTPCSTTSTSGPVLAGWLRCSSQH